MANFSVQQRPIYSSTFAERAASFVDKQLLNRVQPPFFKRSYTFANHSVSFHYLPKERFIQKILLKSLQHGYEHVLRKLSV